MSSRFLLATAIATLVISRIIKNMSTTAVFYASFAILFISYCIHEFYWKRKKLPNGPTPWLILGNIPSFVTAESVDSLFLFWKQKYGGIFTVWVGPFPLVMVADLPTIKKYFITNAEFFSNRWRNFVTDTVMEGANGVIQIDGDKWREQRRFALHTLRDFGVGRPLMEQKIMFEVESIKEFLLDKSGKQIDICSPIAVCVGNIINNMLFGIRYNQGDVEMHRLHCLLDGQSRLVLKSIMGAYIAAPFLTKVPLINSTWNQLMDIKMELAQFLDKQIEEHRLNWAAGHRETDDLTYAYMEEVEKRKENDDDIGFFDDLQLKMLLLDLFFAGMETTVTTLKWAVLYVAKEKKVQKRVQEELDQIRGAVALSDRNRLPYVQATINEIQRKANILPINLLRTVASDVEIDEFSFKKGDMVIPQISILMNDPEYFENPEEFCPDRFLDECNNLKRIDEFMPFSTGKRQCLGESLARAELFLIFANLMKDFEFDVAPDASTKRMLGLTVSPPKYQCVVRPRKVDSNQNSW